MLAEIDETKFKNYLLREFFWELAQHQPLPEFFAKLKGDAIEVLQFEGYESLRIRVGESVFDVQLTWQKTAPASIRRVEGANN